MQACSLMQILFIQLNRPVCLGVSGNRLPYTTTPYLSGYVNTFLGKFGRVLTIISNRETFLRYLQLCTHQNKENLLNRQNDSSSSNPSMRILLLKRLLRGSRNNQMVCHSWLIYLVSELLNIISPLSFCCNPRSCAFVLLIVLVGNEKNNGEREQICQKEQLSHYIGLLIRSFIPCLFIPLALCATNIIRGERRIMIRESDDLGEAQTVEGYGCI